MDEQELFADPPEALIRRWNAEADEAIERTKLTVLEQEKSQIELDRGRMIVAYEHEVNAIKLEDLHRQLASDDFARGFYYFGGEVSERSVYACIARLKAWDRMGFTEPIEIMFSSGGGSMVDGMELLDFIFSMRGRGATINTSTYGMAASMAAVLLQAGETRKCGPNAWIMLHEGSMSEVSGKLSDIENRIEWGKRLGERAMNLVIERAQGTKGQTGRTPLTKTALKKRWQMKDWWIDANEAYKLGLVDEIG